eukprot:CAMPEP_0173439040 /NCGR_PEP_ID=MMETSP1357-20121228/20738_1 /TAXON_ID=77926 /ORGANISM="Hemiselmis rufescens, Strain PCC563" /LENGTH=270 /DNA_ID=CAMNT_0014404375 /DNA_START=150 /DNA_END=959 /DNA_ORIENTATION=+
MSAVCLILRPCSAPSDLVRPAARRRSYLRMRPTGHHASPAPPRAAKEGMGRRSSGEERLLTLASKASAGECGLSRCPSDRGATSGVWFISSSSAADAPAPAEGVFKPSSAEHVPPEMAACFAPGRNMYRERAAHIVSRALGGGVPETVIATVRHGDLPGGGGEGSLQRFSPGEDMGDLGPEGLREEEVQRLALLDLLLLNCDRHEGNVLVTPQGGLVPIDHGLCLPRLVPAQEGEKPPTRVLKDTWFAWQGWRQADLPVSAALARDAAAL